MSKLAKILLGSTLSLAFAHTAVADTVRAEFGFTDTAYETDLADADGFGIGFDIEADYDSGLGLNLSYDMVDIEGLSLQTGEIGASWLFSDIAGPEIRHVRTETILSVENETYLGAAFAYNMGSVDLTGAALMSVDTDDAYVFEMGADYAFDSGASAFAEIVMINGEVSDLDAQSYEIGGRMPLADTGMHSVASVVFTDAGDYEATSLNLGVGFSF